MDLDDAACFGFQDRRHLETGDPSCTPVGIGAVRVDLATGDRTVTGSLRAREMRLFETERLELLGPGGWRLVPPGLVGA
ncbi:hypothetical protein [Streptomyces sp. NEAU-W12]|uniref:hypothetical protein n=1 Tax=Streptomyces sp. NEAU-W12 TaxID=2994668 RepID=UPI00224A958E|nr:hypothetical protein [Streptomyces sp. NEAU-W12]MCX2925529.1 hypothetical protein [Streptomyces sp. NEAU-W12]